MKIVNVAWIEKINSYNNYYGAKMRETAMRGAVYREGARNSTQNISISTEYIMNDTTHTHRQSL